MPTEKRAAPGKLDRRRGFMACCQWDGEDDDNGSSMPRLAGHEEIV
jgi:hypothetical protein